MSLKIKCDMCKSELEAPGALVFSPPIISSVLKYHICVHCWKKLDNWLRPKEKPIPLHQIISDLQSMIEQERKLLLKEKKEQRQK